MGLQMSAIECERAARNIENEDLAAIAKALAAALRGLEEISSSIDDIKTRLSNIEYNQRGD